MVLETYIKVYLISVLIWGWTNFKSSSFMYLSALTHKTLLWFFFSGEAVLWDTRLVKQKDEICLSSRLPWKLIALEISVQQGDRGLSPQTPNIQLFLVTPGQSPPTAAHTMSSQQVLQTLLKH